MLLTACAAWFPAAASTQGEATRLPVQVIAASLIPPPVDHAFAGVIELDVGATNVARKLFVMREVIPAQGAGGMTLLYPRWESVSLGPASWSPSCRPFRHDGRTLPWRRDPRGPHAR